MSRTKQRAGGRKNRPSVDSGEAAVQPTPERARHAEHGIEAAEPERTERGGGRAFVDSAGRPSRPWRVVDTLAVLERVGTLTADQRAAGERFRALFEIGGRAGASAVRLEPRTAAGDPIGAIERRVAAGRALAEAARLLGAPGALYSVTFDICGLGMGLTARDELLRQRRGGSSRMLAEALDILANEWRT